MVPPENEREERSDGRGGERVDDAACGAEILDEPIPVGDGSAADENNGGRNDRHKPVRGENGLGDEGLVKGGWGEESGIYFTLAGIDEGKDRKITGWCSGGQTLEGRKGDDRAVEGVCDPLDESDPDTKTGECPGTHRDRQQIH